MPEGHVTHRIAREQTKLLAGRPVAVSSPQGPFSADAELVDGAVLRSVECYGKHLFYRWSTGHVGHVHLGLFGKFRVHLGGQAPPPVGAVRMRLSGSSGTVDLAGPTTCTIATEADRDTIVARLGPDPLRRDARPQVAIDRLGASRQAIGTLLLDQRVLCGVGNVYRAEALFVTGIRPDRAGRDCDPEALRALWDTIVGMLRQGVHDNRIITIDRREFALPKGRLQRGESTYVYHRDRCLRCGSAVQTIELAGRPCYYCPTCQPD